MQAKTPFTNSDNVRGLFRMMVVQAMKDILRKKKKKLNNRI